MKRKGTLSKAERQKRNQKRLEIKKKRMLEDRKGRDPTDADVQKIRKQMGMKHDDVEELKIKLAWLEYRRTQIPPRNEQHGMRIANYECNLNFEIEKTKAMIEGIEKYNARKAAKQNTK